MLGVAENNGLMLRNAKLTDGLWRSWSLQLCNVFYNVRSSSLILKDCTASINIVDGILSNSEFILKLREEKFGLHVTDQVAEKILLKDFLSILFM